MQQSLPKSGYTQVEILSRGENLVVLWVPRQATVEALNDTSVVSAQIIIIGMVPAPLIRKVNYPAPAKLGVVASELKVR
jgi:hypothetical protein